MLEAVFIFGLKLSYDSGENGMAGARFSVDV